MRPKLESQRRLTSGKHRCPPGRVRRLLPDDGRVAACVDAGSLGHAIERAALATVGSSQDPFLVKAIRAARIVRAKAQVRFTGLAEEIPRRQVRQAPWPLR